MNAIISSTELNDIKLKNKCGQYQIDYVEANIEQGFQQILMQYLIKKQVTTPLTHSQSKPVYHGNKSTSSKHIEPIYFKLTLPQAEKKSTTPYLKTQQSVKH